MYCTDPGEVEHSTRLISDPVLLVGTTIQYTCNPGFVLEGSSLLTCYSRETGTPIWTSRLPHCVCKSGWSLLIPCSPAPLWGSWGTLSCSQDLARVVQSLELPGNRVKGELGCFLTAPRLLLSLSSPSPGLTLGVFHSLSAEESLACDNPGLPENGYQILYKRLYLPGESLTFMCYEGFELMGEVTIKCILGQPSHWSGPLPICKGNREGDGGQGDSQHFCPQPGTAQGPWSGCSPGWDLNSAETWSFSGSGLCSAQPAQSWPGAYRHRELIKIWEFAAWFGTQLQTSNSPPLFQ